ncbi:uncharacterized protein dbr [Drosophila pseudoobscura]|uniref:Uncharacterized protein dbr n=4 Tax=pseudoobscura subgroup TaxID=32358 RepID=A0A6I8UKT2_DROPS|nr:uncharacterized protein LOC4817781 [Drosophila pseudoobscura]
MDAQFEHLCRICAANTKSKNNSVVESVFIFKTQGLKDKISRHLYLNVAEEDPLPKVLCKSCYRQVEATSSLSNIAKHTQLVFRDFLLSTVPKNDREATAARLDMPMEQTVRKNVEKHSVPDEFRPIFLTRGPETTITVSMPQAGTQEEDDIVGDRVKEIHHETRREHALPVASSSYSNSMAGISTGTSNNIPRRRSSVFVDTRYGSAPMSIAQRSMQCPPSLAPLHSDVRALKTSKSIPEKKHSPAGVINFIQTHGRVTGNAPTFSSSSTKKDSGQNSNGTDTRNPQASVQASPSPSSVGIPNLPNSVLQQKRRNLKNALNNIKAIHSGQVSLLKSAQSRQPVANLRPLVTTTVVPHRSLYGCEPCVEEALPEHIIIAAPKKKKDDVHHMVQKGPSKLKKIVSSPTKSAPVTLDLTLAPTGPQSSGPSPSMSNVNSLTDAISLGSVIRDPDLLRLILKALKWPVSDGNCEEQMTRLKSSKFAGIMSDNNLLQDTDLTQLLGPYLAPMLAVVQNHENQSSTSLFASNSLTSPAVNEVINIADLSSSIPYKLPPETSVQLVPSSPTDQEPPQLRLIKTVPSVKRPQRKMRAREFVSGKPHTDTAAATSNAERVTNELLNINSMLMSQFRSNPADALNEALISMLKEQQESKDQYKSHRRRSASSSNLNLEDIVLVEPQPALEGVQTVSDISEVDDLSPQPQEPLITRPIVKRRKTVTPLSELPEIIVPNEEEPLTLIKGNETSAATGPTISKNTEEDTNKDGKSPSPQEPLELSQAPTSTVPEAKNNDDITPNAQEQPEATTDAAAGIFNDIEGVGKTGIRKSDVKSALGQKLLEAIGLPQNSDLPPESSRDTVRSALKRSLKKAQEQQQQLKRVKQEEPVKQLADSTTKPSASESAEEHKKAIAERELALLKRRSKVSEERKPSLKDEKSERTDVSSSSSRNRRNRKSKTDVLVEDSADEEKKPERWDEDDDLPLKTEGEKALERSGSSSSSRPARTSKTMSKYYKGPSGDKTLSSLKSQHSMGTRSTRQR